VLELRKLSCLHDLNEVNRVPRSGASCHVGAKWESESEGVSSIILREARRTTPTLLAKGETENLEKVHQGVLFIP